MIVAPDGTRLAAVELGDADRPAVLLGHGVGSSSDFVVEAFGEAVLAAGWRLVAYDLRGHGRSGPLPDPADHALDRHVADVAALVAAYAPDVVGGVSLGGNAAVAYAARGGACRGVVACLPAWTGRAVPGEGPHAAVAHAVATVGIDGMLARFEHDTAIPAWLRELLLRDWRRHDPASLAGALIALDGGLAPTAAELAAFPVPLAVVAWPDDPGHPDAVAAEWAALPPCAALGRTTLDDVGRDRGQLGQVAVATLGSVGVVPAVSS
jgi:pimeloyl-ACP methyl ester carboxylesterase